MNFNNFNKNRGFSLIELSIASVLGLLVSGALLQHYQLLLRVQGQQQGYYTLLDHARLFHLKMKQQLEHSGVFSLGDLGSYRKQEGGGWMANLSVIPAAQISTHSEIPAVVKQRRKEDSAVFWLRAVDVDQSVYSKWLFLGHSTRLDEAGKALGALYLASNAHPKHTQELITGVENWSIVLGLLEGKQLAWYQPEQIQEWDEVRLVAIQVEFSAPFLESAASSWKHWDYRFKLPQNF